MRAPLDPAQLVSGRHVEGTLQQRSGLGPRRPTGALHPGPMRRWRAPRASTARSAALIRGSSNAIARSRVAENQMGATHRDLSVGGQQEDAPRWTPRPGQQFCRPDSVPRYLPVDVASTQPAQRGVRDRGKQLRAWSQRLIRVGDRRERVEGASIVARDPRAPCRDSPTPTRATVGATDVRRCETPPVPSRVPSRSRRGT